MLYETESETWTEKKDNVDREKENDARIVRWMCIVRPEDKISIVELRNRLRWNIIRECLQNGRLHAFYISTTFEHKLSIIASLEKLLIFYIRIIMSIKGYLRYKMTTSQNVLSEAQIQKFFIS